MRIHHPRISARSFVGIIVGMLITLGLLIWTLNSQKAHDSNQLNLTFDDSAPKDAKLQQEDLCAKGKCIFLSSPTTIDNPISLKLPFTFTAWIRPTATSSATLATFKDGSTEKVKLTITDHGKLFLSTPNSQTPLTSPDSLELANWQQITLVMDKDITRIYTNGSLEGKIPLSSTANLSSLTLGPMTGFLDEVKLYPKVLTDQEIIDDHANMVLYWRGEKP